MLFDGFMKFRSFRAWGAAALIIVLAGCGTVQQTYIPRHVGSLEDGQELNGLTMTLTTPQDSIHIGQPLVLCVSFQNRGSTPLRISRQPAVLLTWIYPDGKQDNFLGSSPFDQKEESLSLQPGECRSVRSIIRTDYFHITGITEFRALMTSPLDHLTPVELASNGIGIRIIR